MTVDLRHLFVSPIASTGSNRLVQGPNWNEAHNLQQGPQTLLGRSDAAAGQAATQEIQLDPSLGFVGGKLAALAGGPPSGAAGGDLAGSYPNPLIKPSVTNGQVLTTVGGVSTWATSTAAIDVGSFGAVGDGVTDDTAAIQAAIDAAGAVPCADVLLAGKTYLITNTLQVPWANVTIIGAGADVAHTQTPQGGQAATHLKWAGAAGGTMMHIHSPVGATAQALSGGGVQGIYFDCGVSAGNDGAGVGLQISSRRSGWYQDLFFEQPRDVGLLLDTVLQLGDDRGCHNNVFFTCASRNTYTNQDGGFVRLQGDVTIPPGMTNSNCFFNTFQNCRPVFNSGICYDLGNSDHNRFIGNSANCQIHSYAATSVNATISLANPAVVTAVAHGFITGHCIQFISNADTLPAPLAFSTKYYVTKIDNDTFRLSTTLANRIAGTFIDTSASSQAGTHKLLAYSGYGILLRGSNIVGNEARLNTFFAFSGGDVISCQGTETGLLSPSHHNVFAALDYSNSTPQPTVGTGSSVSVQWRDDGTQPRGKFIAPAIGGPSLIAVTNSLLMDNVQARMVNESMRVSNGSSDHVRLEVPSGDYLTTTAEWSVAGVSATGDLRILRTAGTGLFLSGVGVLGTSSTLGVGYATGAGGTVAQATSKATLVSLNRCSGLITTFNDALAAGAAVTFQWNNSAMALGDLVILNHDTNIGGTAGAYVLNIRVAAAGGFVTIRNLTAGSLSEAIGIRFALIKGVVA